MAMRPPTTQARRIKEGSPTIRATFEGLAKIPTPIIAPATTTVASRSPSSRRNPEASAEADSIRRMRTGAAYVRGETPVKQQAGGRPAASALRLELDRDREGSIAAQHLELHGVSHVVALQDGGQVIRRADRLAVHGPNDVAGDDRSVRRPLGAPQARGLGGRAARHVHHHDSFHPEPFPHEAVDALVEAYPQLRMADAAVADELRDDSVHGVDGHGEADSRVRARGAVDRGVHADQPARAVEQRTAGVARVDGGVRLDDVLDWASGDALDRTAEGGHDAGRERLVQTEGIADCEDLLPDLKVPARAQGNGPQILARRADAQDRQVVLRRGSRELGAVRAVARKRHARR